MKKIRIGSRDSRLALVQTQMVVDAIHRYDPSMETEIVALKTTGDRILDKTLDQIGGKGLFVKELDEALLDRRVDITVHSYKDLPMEENEGLPIIALSQRADCRDVWVSSKAACPNAPIGCASKRRTVQLKALFPQCEVQPIRGNIQTRLEKLDRGAYSALVLAAAGLQRLGLEQRIGRYFEVDELLPAASQGIVAVQGRKGEDYAYVAGFDCAASHVISQAERSFVRALDGGCSAPVAAFARMEGSLLWLNGMYCDDGGKVHKGSCSGALEEAQLLGAALAAKLKAEK